MSSGGLDPGGPAVSFAPSRLAEHPWDDPALEVPARIGEVTGMLLDTEKRMLYWLTRHWYSGEGAICDLGAFLGGSTICFLTALAERGETRRVLHSYDYWKLGEFERSRYFADGAPPYDLTYPLFEQNIRGYTHLAYAHPGDVVDHRWTSGPIEILFVDIAKTYLSWDHVVSEFFPSLVPGRSLVILQDYLYEQTGPWHHVVMEKLISNFEYVTDTGRNSVVFRHTSAFEPGVIDSALWLNIPGAEKERLMDAAIARMDTAEKREILQGPREMLAPFLGDGTR